MSLKIAVVNNSGNVGKSTTCEVLLKPRMENAEIIKVESINSDGTTDETLSAKDFNEILKMIDMADTAIVDVGASNIEIFVEQMKVYKDSHEDIDYFLIPVIPFHKQQVDSVATVAALLNLGVDPENIKIVFNQVDKLTDIKKQFSYFFNDQSVVPELSLEKLSVIYFSDVFSFLNTHGKNFNEVLNDDSDFKSMLKSAETKEERGRISEARSIKRLVDGVNEELNIAFEKLSLV